MDNDSENPVPAKDKGFSRRKFLTGVGLGAAALVTKVTAAESEPKESNFETLKVGNLTIKALSVEHNIADWEIYKDLIIDLIEDSTFVIPEYFSPEQEMIKQKANPLYDTGLSVMEAENKLFNKVADTCAEKNKDVWRVDPAYCEEFLKLKAALVGTDYVAEAAIGYPLISTLMTAKKNPNGTMTRRSFLQSAAKIAIGEGVSKGVEAITQRIVGKPLSPDYTVEKDFRHVLTAEALIALGAKLEQPTNVFLMYPKAHMDGIKKYLENDKERESRFKIFSNLKGVKQFEKLFESKEYARDNDKWKQVDSITI